MIPVIGLFESGPWPLRTYSAKTLTGLETLSVYIETTTAGEAGKIDISKIGATFARTWKIKVNYIPCDSPVR